MLCALAAFAGCGEDRPPLAPVAPVDSRMRYDGDGTPADGPVGRVTRPLIVLVCLDTVRADALAPWANGTPAMPETSEWLAGATTIFRDAHAAAPWTAPSVASLLTGLLPSEHGLREFDDQIKLVSAVPTVAEMLARAGATCGAFTGGGWVRDSNGVLQGFADAVAPFSFGAGAQTLVGNHRMLKARGAGSYFLFLHTYEAHDPYGAPPARLGASPAPPTEGLAAAELAAIDAEAAADGGRSLVRRFLLDPASRATVFETAAGGRRADVVRRWFEHVPEGDPKAAELLTEARRGYEAGLRRLDHAVATYLKGADDAHVFDDAIVIFCSDHGEGFGEHGAMHHGRRLYEELTHVPLAIRAPGWPRGKVIDGPCSLLDVAPTILDLCGLPAAKGHEGRSLASMVRGAERAPRLAVSEERRTPAETGLPGDVTLVSVRDSKTTWIGTRDRRTGELTAEAFDRESDPHEVHPLDPKAALPRASEALRRRVEALVSDGVR